MEVVEAAEVRGAEVVEGAEVRGVEMVEGAEVSGVEVVEDMEGSGVEVSCTTSAGKAEGKIRFKRQGRTDGEKQHPPKKTRMYSHTCIHIFTKTHIHVHTYTHTHIYISNIQA